MTVETELATLTTSVEGFVSLAETKKEILDTQTALGVGHQDSARTAELTAEAHEEAAKLALESAYQNNRSIDSIYTQNLNAIAGTKTESARDVFVYDTSKDSDGGAWRNRTQHTSWYNEPLNTSTRGSRKEFPVVAIIVAELYKVTVYDGDDPSIPMWIIFAAGTNSPRNTGWFNSGGLSSVVALNADIFFTQSSGQEDARGLLGVNFVKDELTRRDGARLNFGRKVSDRAINNAGMENNTDLSQKLVASTANDVAITVLPGAPIDRDTRLPVPTVAVATVGGVSVITDSGAIYDGSWTNVVSKVAFDNYGRLFWARGSDILYLSETYSSDGHGFWAGTVRGWGGIDLLTSIESLQVLPNGFATASSSPYTGSTTVAGLASYCANSGNLSNSLSNLVTSTYNTGWMNGDMKLATLSDTDTTDITGTELIDNNNFAAPEYVDTAAATARQDLITTNGWIITDGGEA